MDRVNKMIADLEAAVIAAIDVPSEWLPESYRDGRRKTHTSLQLVHNRMKKNGLVETEKQKEKRERLERIKQYAKQYEETGEFEYDVDNDRLYANQVAFVNAGVRSGMIELDD